MASENEKYETLADIVAEMRTRSREVKEAFGGRPDGVENMLDIWAERIDAIGSADALRSLYTPGNAAALREALEAAHKFVYTACRQNIDVMVKDKHGERVVKSKDVLYKIYSALSAPPRNCDLFGGDPKMLNTAWFDWTASPSGHDANGAAKMTFAGWLLAPAAERKGEDYGK